TGLKQSTMDQIAGYAGVSKVIYYRYFGSKDNLIHTILGTVVDRLLEADQKDVESWTDLVPMTLHIARENKDAMTLLIRQAAHDPKYGSHFQRLRDVMVERSRQRQMALFSDVIDHSIETPVSVTFLAETTMAMFFESYVRWLETGDAADDEKFIDWVIKSVRAMGYYWAGENPPQ
ncbi:MAG TPA: TetR/AcrR family transcriptional regulator, partial [Hellea balneolensis]|nr:TetR/AcrR family transcriptional regulator [Hellea balneolensis]